MLRATPSLLLALFACNRQPSPTEAAPTSAQVGPTPVVSDAVVQKRAEARKQAEQEAAAAAERKTAELEALAQLPATPPKTLPKACDEMVKAYDQYMRRVLTDDMLTKWTTGGNEMQLAVFAKECASRSIPVAACQAQALGKMTREQYSMLADVMGLCLKKFGGA